MRSIEDSKVRMLHICKNCKQAYMTPNARAYSPQVLVSAASFQVKIGSCREVTWFAQRHSFLKTAQVFLFYFLTLALYKETI